MQRIGVFLFLVLSVFVLPLDAQEFRTWKSATGEYSTEAILNNVNNDGKTVVLKKRNGKLVKVIIAQLSESDQAYIRKSGVKPSQAVSGSAKDDSSNYVDLPTYPFELVLGSTPKEIRSKCEIIEENFDKVSNWRIMKIKPKNRQIESIEAIFRNEDTLGYYLVRYKNPTRAMAIVAHKVLSKSFPSPEKLKFSTYSDGDEQAVSSMYKKKDGTMAYLSYFYSKEKKAHRLTLCERRADTELTEAMRTVLYTTAKDGILEILKAPATAVFEPQKKMTYEIRNYEGGYYVYLVVDAQNTYGAMLRARYGVPVYYQNGHAKVEDLSKIIEVKRGENYLDALLREIDEKLKD